MSKAIKKAVIFLYIGTPPVYFDLFLTSCKNNLDIDFLIYGDCFINYKDQKNVFFHNVTLGEIKSTIENIVCWKLLIRSCISSQYSGLSSMPIESLP